jgi:hypothetical protein
MSILHERVELLRKSLLAYRVEGAIELGELMDLFDAVLDIIDGVPFNVPENARR